MVAGTPLFVTGTEEVFVVPAAHLLGGLVGGLVGLRSPEILSRVRAPSSPTRESSMSTVSIHRFAPWARLLGLALSLAAFSPYVAASPADGGTPPLLEDDAGAPVWVSRQAATADDGRVDWQLLGVEAWEAFSHLEAQPTITIAMALADPEMSAVVETVAEDGVSKVRWHKYGAGAFDLGHHWGHHRGHPSGEHLSTGSATLGTVLAVGQGFFRGEVGSLATVRIDRALRTENGPPTDLVYVYYPAARFSIGDVNFWKEPVGTLAVPGPGDRIEVATDRPAAAAGPVFWPHQKSLTLERASGACTGLMSDNIRAGLFDQVYVTSSTLTPEQLQAAVNAWNACPGQKFPEFVTEQPAGSEYYIVTITSERLNNSGDRHCGRYTPGNNLTIFESYSQGTTPTSCGPVWMTAAHELGHWLGLDDIPLGENCLDTQGTSGSKDDRYYIMSELTDENRFQRGVSDAECGEADRKWSMKGECSGANPPGEGCFNDRLSDLPGLCDKVPELCERPASAVDDMSWWTVNETSPTLECETGIVTTCGATGCSRSTTVYCAYELATRAPTGGLTSAKATVTAQGPATGLDPLGGGGVVSGLVALNGWAADPEHGVSSVSFWLDGQPWVPIDLRTGISRPGICNQVADPACPYVGFTGVMDTRALSNGSHVLEVVSAEARPVRPGPTLTAVSFVVDNAAPDVWVSSPGDGALLSGSVTVRAHVSDATAVDRVRFRVDGVWPPTFEDATAPYRFAWSTAGLTDGEHELWVEAVDLAGGFTRTVLHYTVDNTLPTLSIGRPANQQVVSGAELLASGWALDASGVVEHELALDGQPISAPVTATGRQDACNAYPAIGDPRCPWVGWSAPIDVSGLASGSHSLDVTVTDAAGISRTLRRWFQVARDPITVSFPAIADSYAVQSSPDYTGGGSGGTLVVRTPDEGNGAYSFLKFSVSGVTGSVVSARLRIKIHPIASLSELYLYGLEHSNWTESTLSWNNFPGAIAYLDHRLGLAADTWYEFDATGFITGDGVYSLGFAADVSGGYLRSRESAYVPVLEVTYLP
jgi:hypothetical protein